MPLGTFRKKVTRLASSLKPIFKKWINGQLAAEDISAHASQAFEIITSRRLRIDAGLMVMDSELSEGERIGLELLQNVTNTDQNEKRKAQENKQV